MKTPRLSDGKDRSIQAWKREKESKRKNTEALVRSIAESMNRLAEPLNKCPEGGNCELQKIGPVLSLAIKIANRLPLKETLYECPKCRGVFS